MTNSSTTTKEALEPSLEDLALQAAVFLESFAGLESDRIRGQQIAFALRARVTAPIVAPVAINTGLHCNGCGLLIEGWPNVYRCVTRGCGRIYHYQCLLDHCASDHLCQNCKQSYKPYVLHCDKCGAEAFDCCLSKLCKQCGESFAPASTVAQVEQSEYFTATVQAGPVIDTRAATDEIVNWIASIFPPALSGPYSKEGRRIKVESILERHFAAAPASPAALRDEADELVDGVQHRMDQVVEAAVEWHEAGQEGGEWLEAAEKLGAAINSLLEFRGDPHNMPRRWCSVHNCEEFKYESLEHELRSARSRHVGSSRHPYFTHADHERMKETLDALSDCPTEEEAEAVLQACGTSGKAVVNEFIERLLRENLELRTKLDAATTPPSTAAKAAAEEIVGPLPRINDDYQLRLRTEKVDRIAAIIERCLFTESEDQKPKGTN